MGIAKDILGGLTGGLLGGGRKTPKPPPVARPAAPAPTVTDPAVLAAREAQARKSKQASYMQTVLTSPSGLSSSGTLGGKTVLGS